jgi:excinuclease ABC subunit C
MDPVWWKDDFPRESGVYIFRDAEGQVLYVGKAASLRDRLRSYRSKEGDGRLLIRFLSDQARTLETIVTRTELEALLLEDSLIKAHKPPHNIRLKDDKSFLMLRLDLGERFPRFKLVRAHSPKQGAQGRSRLFGPYASAKQLRQTLVELQSVFPMRDCPDAVMNHRTRPCLKHQIGLCKAPCVGLIDEAAYAELVERASRVLSGDPRELEHEIEKRMRESSLRRDYERAAWWRDRLAALRATSERQGVLTRDTTARDVLHLARAGERAVVQRLSFREGRLAESRAHVFRSQLDDPELLHGVLTALYSAKGRELPEELVLPCEPADPDFFEHLFAGRTKLVVPQGGERARMLQVAFENARTELERSRATEAREEAGLEALAALLDLDALPEVIDCFDISNLQGTNVVASRVRFRSGHPDRAGYRRFKVRGVEGQDDFASMREVVGRSLKRGTDEGELPDLVVIDGGAQQLESAIAARDEAGAWDVRFIGLAKARSERKVGGKEKSKSEERIFLPGVEQPIELGKHNDARHLLERVRDEAHRFAITYHRKERGRIESQLDSIPRVGPARRKALLRAFGSVQGVKAASVEAIAAVEGIGMELAQAIREHLARERP